MKKTLFAILFISMVVLVQAQVIKVDSTSNWRKSFKAGLNLNQASFSDNWKAGGVNSIGFASLLNYKGAFKRDKNSFTHELDLLYGMVRNQGQGMRKTLDRVYYDAKYGRAISSQWNMAASVNFLTQFAPGYNYVKDANGVEQPNLISDVFAPAFITAALGFEYKPNNFFKARISPFAPRLTVVRDNNGRFDALDPVAPYGVKVGEETRFEWYAFQLLVEYNKEVAKNITFNSRYMMYANYETIEAKTIDHRLDLNLIAKINSRVNVNIGGIFLYDYDQDAEAQYSQSLNIGIAYSFQNYEDKK